MTFSEGVVVPARVGRAGVVVAPVGEPEVYTARDLRFVQALVSEFPPKRGRPARPPTWAPVRQPMALGEMWMPDLWSFTRPFSGEVMVLDMCASWPSAISSAVIGHGALERTESAPFEPGKRVGLFRVTVHPWDVEREGMPSPVRQGGDTEWVSTRVVDQLCELSAQRRWGEVRIVDQYTADAVRCREWAAYLNAVRVRVLERAGPDRDTDDQVALVKREMAKAVTLLAGAWAKDADGAPLPREGAVRQFATQVCRPDWSFTWQWQALCSTWSLGDDLRRMLPAELAPVALRKRDEVLIPVEAWEFVRDAERPKLARSGELARPRGPVRWDEEPGGVVGAKLGTVRVKGTERVEFTRWTGGGGRGE